MPMPRIWLDWTEPALPAAARWLLEQQPSDGSGDLDLGDTVCVLPGRRAARGLLAALVAACRDAGRSLIPPHVLTPGALADHLLDFDRPPATDAEVRLAWMHALRSADAETAGAFLPVLPDAADDARLHALAGRLASIADELAGERITFDDVAEHADDLLLHDEADRWRAMQRLHHRCVETLAGVGLADPGAARAAAVEQPLESLDRIARVVLVGVTDLNRLQRRLVERLDERAVALIVAPETEASRFDDCGCVVPQAWAELDLAVDDGTIALADRPADQAQLVLERLAALGGRYAASAVTLGLGDESLAETMARAGRWADVGFHAAAGRPLATTSPGRLLSAVADLLTDGAEDARLALLRHPDCPRRTPLPGDDEWRGRRPLGEWTDPVVSLLESAYVRSDHGPTIEACAAVRDLLAAYRRVPVDLQPSVTAAAALRIVLADAASKSIAEEPRGDAIEMLGWLELAFDPAPVLIVTGVNDGHVPAAVTGDPFLPDALRRRAGLMCNSRRYARDAWVMQVLRHVREALTLVCGRRAADGEPLPPSRLLLTGRGVALANRIKRLSDADAAHHAETWIGAPSPAARSGFTIPEPPPGPVELDTLYVTAFRSYLDCPYRFWLRHVMKLRTAEDDLAELDGARFGSLAHDVLEAFGRDETIRDSTDARRIAAFLVATLERHARDAYRGRTIPPAVRIQVRRLATRLEVFARRQAAHRRAGWRIEHAEQTLADTALLTVPGQPDLRITGKVDRVDRHEDDGRWMVIDYKTGDKAKTPDVAHRRHGAWTDLQLPLYHHLLDVPAETTTLAYFNLPNEAKKVELCTAPWTLEELAGAVDEARRIVKEIRAGRFPRNEDSPWRRDEFASICQTTVLGADLQEATA